MDKISIIIPVYNVEPFISKCLDSIAIQTFTDFEALLINDGSTDKSGEICEAYSMKDSRIKVFHKKNGGVSSAKNLGLKYATGQYIGFVDSDDFVAPDMYEMLYKAINKENVQIGIANYYKANDTQSVAMTNSLKIPDGIISTRNMLRYQFQRDHYMGFCGYLWNKLFLSEAIKNSDLRFDESINYGEDVLFLAKLVIENKCTGTYIDKPVYHYYQRVGSISKSASLEVQQDILKAYKMICSLFSDSDYEDMEFWVRGFYCHHASIIAETAINNKDKETLALMQYELRYHLSDYMRSNRAFPEKFYRMETLLNYNL
ncbi:MAG: glycosyltransferase [Oscillospiraceae bacterium]|nr:glycosyltransferase [Oscillospiraceae bacterium]